MKNKLLRFFLLAFGMYCMSLEAATLPTFSSNTYNILSYGAVSSTTVINTAAIQSAIDACTSAGGGHVIIPEGLYLSGPITMKSNVDLQLLSGATLRALPYGSGNGTVAGTYPNSGTTDDYTDFIYASKQTNVQVSGSGLIDGQGYDWWRAYEANSDIARPGLIRFDGCTNMAVIGISMLNSPCVNITFGKSGTNGTIRDITVRAPASELASPLNSHNTDGIDTWCPNVDIINCDISTGDDNVAMDTGSKNIYIKNCKFGTGHGVSVGSYATGIENINVDSCTFTGTTNGIRLKSDQGRGGIEQNFTYTNLTMTGVKYPFYITSHYIYVPSTPSADTSTHYTSLTPSWNHVKFKNITATNCTYAGYFYGIPAWYINDVSFDNVTISATYYVQAYYVSGMVFGGGSSITVGTKYSGATFRTYNASIAGIDLTTGKPVYSTPSISFDAIPAKTVLDADFSVTASVVPASMTITLSTDNESIAKIVNNKVHIVGAGTCNVIATAAAWLNYSAASKTQSVTISAVGTAPQTITFPYIRSVTDGYSDFALSATTSATSTLTVVYASSNEAVATITSDQKVHVVKDGSTVITAYQLGDNIYMPATPVSRTLVIRMRTSQTINFSAIATQSYGVADLTVATATSGLALSYSLSNSAVASAVSGKIKILKPGTCTITASQAGDTSYYAATSLSQILTIVKASQTITFDALPSKKLDDADFQLPISNSSNLPLTVISSNSNIASISGTNTVHLGGQTAGTCVITVSNPGNDYYEAATKTQSLVVKATGATPQTIVFDPMPSVTDGYADFAIPATSSSGLSLNFVSSKESVVHIEGNLIQIKGIGTAIITASQDGNLTYAPAVSVSRTLVIRARKNQTITFDAIPSKVYGSANFAPASASSGLAVSYSVSDTSVAVVTADQKIQIKKVGTTQVYASQVGDTSYYKADVIDQTLSVAKASQTITFDSIPSKMTSDKYVIPTVKTSSGLKVSLSSSNLTVARISGDTIKIIGAGTTVISASQPGNTNFNAATTVKKSFVVKSGTLVREISSVGNSLVVYPQPVSDNLNVVVNLIQKSNVRITVYDCTGKLIDCTYSGVLPEGEFSMSKDCAKWPKGLYFMKLETNEQTIVNKVLKK